MPRVDRLATLYLFHKMAAMKSASKEIHIPVLMYHDITDQGKYHGRLAERTPAEDFRQAHAVPP
jgi:hypothetical protein